VQSAEFILGDDDLAGRDLQLISSAPGLIRPLAVRAAAEPSWPARTGLLVHWTVTPAAPITVG
jgi:hypothetical protein